MTTRTLTTIGFDADDTLWQNEQFYRLTETHFTDLLSDSRRGQGGLPEPVACRGKRNLQHYGFGIKGFTLSMIETAIEITEGNVPASVIAQICRYRRDLLYTQSRRCLKCARRWPPFPTITCWCSSPRATFSTRSASWRNPGSGISSMPSRSSPTRRPSPIAGSSPRSAAEPEQAMMVGNSLKSDIVPAIAAGSYGVFVPHELTWVLEHVEEPTEAPRFRRSNVSASACGVIDSLG